MMKKIVYPALLYLLITITSVKAQENTTIVDHFENYISAPREVVYAHLNKSIYLKGETLGFSAYIFDKGTKSVSKNSTNLYCVITDKNDKIVKKALVKIENGIASNSFKIDSLFTAKTYKFKAYTNWMRNFDEQNHFEAYFSVINPDGTEVTSAQTHNDIDLQVLGEGGHILYDVRNTVGIIAKKYKGYGVANAKGNIIDEKGVKVSEFKLNEVGLAKTIFMPQVGEKYFVSLDIGENTITRPIENIKHQGLVMNLTTIDNEVRISLNTNLETYQTLKDDSFLITVHNGNKMIQNSVNLNENGNATIIYSKDILFEGINIFTVFNKNQKPLLERLFFYKNRIKQKRISSLSINPNKDSLDILLNFNSKDAVVRANVSMSILPKTSKSYEHHNNLLSQLYIQPYINGYLENGHQYFNSSTPKTDYNLDLLMLTQGWSSYNWNAIFKPLNTVYNFEKGLKVNANINNRNYSGKPKKYMLYSSNNTSPTILKVNDNKNTFTFENIFPTANEKIYISEINRSDGIIPASLYLQSSPSTIPRFTNNLNTLEPISFEITDSTINKELLEFDTLNNVQVLDEVTIVGQNEKKQQRLEVLEKKARWSDIYTFDDKNRQTYRSFPEFINMNTNFRAQITNSVGSGLRIYNPRSATGQGGAVTVYLDNILLGDTSILTNFPMQFVDYIEINRTGLGEGIWGQFGVIKIFTGPDYKSNKKLYSKAQAFDFPLVFEDSKTFYTPKYSNYGDLYKSYGIIDWKPRLQSNENGNIELSIKKSNMPFTIHIEGITSDGDLISETKNIDINSKISQ